MYIAIAVATCTMISAARRLAPSSSIWRRMWIAALSVLRTWPRPPQCVQVTKLLSASDGRSRWRLISSKPKWLMLPIWMRARSSFSASFIRRSTMRVVLLRLHIDEVDHHQSGQIAQPQLPRHFAGGFQVGAQRRLLDAALARRTARVHVDRHQRLGLVDHQIAAGLELHRRLQHGVELRVDRVLGEQRLAVAAPQDHLLGVARHQHAHEVARRLPAFLAVHQDFVDVARIDVADRALDQAGFLVDQRGRDRAHRVVADIVPQPQQIFAVALDLGLRPVRAGGAHDQAHAARNVEFGGDFLQPAPVGRRGDLARDAAAARRVRHQHAEASGERDIGGQRRPLGAALLLHHLHQQDLPALDDFLDLVAAHEARHPALRGLPRPHRHRRPPSPAEATAAQHRRWRSLRPRRRPSASISASTRGATSVSCIAGSASGPFPPGSSRIVVRLPSCPPHPSSSSPPASIGPRTVSVTIIAGIADVDCGSSSGSCDGAAASAGSPSASAPCLRQAVFVDAGLMRCRLRTPPPASAAITGVGASSVDSASAARSSSAASRSASSACIAIRRCRSATGIW